MSEIVSSFKNLKIGDFEYLFIIVTWNDYMSEVSKEVEKHFESFGEDLGGKGKVIKPFKSVKRDTAEELLSKQWPDEIEKKLNALVDPILLIISKDFEEFNPGEDPWAIIEFSDYFAQTNKIYKVFSLLANIVKRRENIFEFLEKETKRKNFKKWLGYIEVKPGIFGFKINGNAILEDLI